MLLDQTDVHLNSIRMRSHAIDLSPLQTAARRRQATACPQCRVCGGVASATHPINSTTQACRLRFGGCEQQVGKERDRMCATTCTEGLMDIAGHSVPRAAWTELDLVLCDESSAGCTRHGFVRRSCQELQRWHREQANCNDSSSFALLIPQAVPALHA